MHDLYRRCNDKAIFRHIAVHSVDRKAENHSTTVNMAKKDGDNSPQKKVTTSPKSVFFFRE